MSTKFYRCWKTYFELYLYSAPVSAEEISSTIANVNSTIPPENNEGMLTECDSEKQRYVNNRAISAFTFYSGKSCNDLRLLRTNQTSRHISNKDDLKRLFNQEINILRNKKHSTFVENDDFQSEKVTIKDGIKLPKTVDEWNQDNDYFRAVLNTSENILNIYKGISGFQNCICDYFNINEANKNNMGNTEANILCIEYNYL